MTLPVSSYEELLLRVRSLTHETIQLRRELSSSLTDPQPEAGPSDHCGYATHPQRRLSADPVRKSNDLNVEDLDLGGLRISDARPTRPTSLFPKTKQHEADDELKEVDEKRSTPEHHRGEWGPESLGLWHSGPSSLGFTHAGNNNLETSSVMSFSSSVCGGTVNAPAPRRTYSHQQLGTKVEMVYNLLSMLGTSDREDMSKTLLAMSSTAESCQAMRQSGCLPLLIQLIHATELERGVRARAAEALHNIVHAQTDDKRRRREARVLKLLQTVREHCDLLKAEGDQVESEKHPGAAVAALMKFSFDAEHRQAMCTLGGLHAIAELTQVEHQSHGIMTEETHCVTMRRYAGMALTNLTFGDGANKALLCSLTKFMEALVAQLTSPSDDLRQVTASVIRNLSWRADAGSKASLREVGAVTALMVAAMEATKEPTLKSILSALWNLSAHCSMNKVDICSVPGALSFLVRTLRYKATSNTLGIIENAGGILRNVSSHVALREDYRQILRDAGCFEVLLEQLKSPSLTVVSNACGTLWNLSARCAEDQRRLWDMGATSMLRSLVQSKHKMIALGSSAALKNLLSANPNGNMMAHLDSTARGLGLQNLPTLFARKQRALEQELDATLAATVGTIESEERGPCRRSDSKESVTSTQSDSVYERVARGAGKVLENKDVTLHDSLSETGGTIRRNDEAKLLRRFRSSGIPTPVSRKQAEESSAGITKPARRGIPVFKNRLKSREESKSSSSSPRFGSGTLPCPGELEEETNECPVNYSLQYQETEPQEKDRKPLPSVPVPVTNDLYAETDLDQPTDFSLKYGEEESSDEDVVQRYGYYDSNKNETEDTIRTYYTEGTPYEGTPYNFSSANSMSDLRIDLNDSDGKAATEEKEKESPKPCESVRSVPESGMATPEKLVRRELVSGVSTPERPVQYCEEGTPGGCFSRVSSLSSLSGKESNKTSPGKKEKESKKLVTFTVDETPLMFSRSSSLTSLNSLAPPLPDQDGGSSVVSTFSRVTSGAISPSDLPDSPTQSVPISATASVRDIPLAPSAVREPPLGESVFDDSLERYKVEGTPIEFSRQTSLSCLTCEHTGSSGSSMSGDVKVGGPEVEATPEPCQDRLELSSVSEGDEDTDEHILADCISIGMQDTRNRPRISSKPTNKPIVKPRCGIPVKAPRHVYEDSVQTYHTEDTPASISHAGSHSDLSVPQPEDGSCNSSDTENILNECIHSGMPQSKPAGGSTMGLGLSKRGTTTMPVPHVQVELKRKDLVGARDELSTFATENSPCTFSVRSSLSDLTVNTSDSLGPLNPRSGLMISPALNSVSQGASPSSISLVDSEDGVKGVVDEKRDGWDEKLSRPNTRASSDAGQPTSNSEDLVTALSRSLSVESFDSCEPTPQEQALLEQCIHSGMPHRPKNVNAVSAVAIKGAVTAADGNVVDGSRCEKNPSDPTNTMTASTGVHTWSDDVMAASAGGHTWSDDASICLSLGSVASNDQDGLRVVEVARPAFRVGDSVTAAPGVTREAARVSRELRRIHEAELLASVTSDMSLMSCDSFLDAELNGLELPDRPTPDFLASEDHPVTLKLLKLKNSEPLSAPSLGAPLHIDFDLEGSMISVASITSEVAESATLADGSDTEIPEDDFSSHSQESLPRDETSPIKIPRKLTPKEKRRLSQDRYRTYTVDELKAKCEQERITPKQRRLNDKERFLTRTISEEERMEATVGQYSTYRVRKERPQVNGLSRAEKLQVVANATLIANTLTSGTPTYDGGVFPIGTAVLLADPPDLSINTETYVAEVSSNRHKVCEDQVEADDTTVCDENGLTEEEEEDVDEDDDAKGPRITVPTATPNAPPPKTVRGRRKPLYSSPRHHPPPPLVREGTFTKEEGSGKSSRLPEPKSAKAGIPRPATSAIVNKTAPRPSAQKRPSSVGPHHSSQPSSNNSVKRHSVSSVPTMKNSSSNHSIKSTGSAKSATKAVSSATASPEKFDKSRQGTGRPRTPKKEVTSKIASLWKKVEETKKKEKGSKDRRVWITPKQGQNSSEPDAEEVLVIEQEELVEIASGKIVRSSTFQGDEASSKPQDVRVRSVRNSGDFSTWSGSKTESRQSAIVPPFNYNPPSAKSTELKSSQSTYPKKITTV